MKKSYLMLAAAAALFAACSSNDLAEEKQSPQNQEPAAEQAVDFNVYVGRGTTRAGYAGEMNNTNIVLSKAAGGGFGVFGYYTDGELYAGNTKPNFFYNQGVFKGTSTWEYTPVKYWPNEFGSDAISDQVDRVTLFAYAPYVEVDPLTGVVTGDNTKNITGMTRNNATGDPFVKYTATMDASNTVDLCYAVAAEDFTSSNSTTFPNDIKKGQPYINVTKPGLGDPGVIKFDFKHALAKLNVTVDYDVNEVSHGSNSLNDFTKIWIRSVTFEGITSKGALNLNSGEWYQIDASGDNKISGGTITVYDGRKEGKEAIGAAANEAPATLNPALVQSLPYDKDAWETALKTTDPTKVNGVESSEKNLFKFTTSTDPVYVIPTGEKMKVTIVYDVETLDKNLAYYLSDGVTPGSTIQNTITKTIDTFGELEAGKHYVLKLHLGMRSVDFTANVIGWDETTPDSNTDLPSNLPAYAAASSSSGELGEATIGASELTYQFAVTGFTAGETLTITPSSGDFSASDADNKASAAGVADITATFAAPNTTTSKKPGTVTVSGVTSNKGGQVKVYQAPHAFGLEFVSATSTTITVKVGATGGIGEGVTGSIKTSLPAIANIKVEDVNAIGTNLASSVSEYVITTSSELTSGKKYKVTVTDGDVTEFFTFTKN